MTGLSANDCIFESQDWSFEWDSTGERGLRSWVTNEPNSSSPQNVGICLFFLNNLFDINNEIDWICCAFNSNVKGAQEAC